MTLAISPLDDRLNKALALASRTPKQITSETCSAAVEAYLAKKGVITKKDCIDCREVKDYFEDWMTTKQDSHDDLSSLEDFLTYYSY